MRRIAALTASTLLVAGLPATAATAATTAAAADCLLEAEEHGAVDSVRHSDARLSGGAGQRGPDASSIPIMVIDTADVTFSAQDQLVVLALDFASVIIEVETPRGTLTGFGSSTTGAVTSSTFGDMFFSPVDWSEVTELRVLADDNLVVDLVTCTSAGAPATYASVIDDLSAALSPRDAEPVVHQAETARTHAEAGRDRAAANSLDAVERSVDRLEAKGALSAADADALRAALDELRAQLA